MFTHARTCAVKHAHALLNVPRTVKHAFDPQDRGGQWQAHARPGCLLGGTRTYQHLIWTLLGSGAEGPGHVASAACPCGKCSLAMWRVQPGHVARGNAVRPLRSGARPCGIWGTVQPDHVTRGDAARSMAS